MKITDFDLQELASFRSTQRLAYDCVRHVATQLEPGMTEKQACTLMNEYLAEHGVSQMFHEPFAWFGDRTAFRGFASDQDFMPTHQELEKGMPVTLDIAPIVDGFAADIGYSIGYGKAAQAEVERLQKVLMECRDFILKSVRARKSFRQIYRELDGLIARHGLVNVHRIYPERVLAHRVVRYGRSPLQTFLQRFRVMGFGLPSYVWVLGKQMVARMFPRLVDSPLWNDGIESEHAPLPGVWAVEPHIATPDYLVGAKWEEILVITQDDAYWLDDEVPHCQLAREKGWMADERPVPARKKARVAA